MGLASDLILASAEVNSDLASGNLRIGLGITASMVTALTATLSSTLDLIGADCSKTHLYY
jgi:hypothetical protein